MDERVVINGSKDRTQIDIQGKVMPDKRRGRSCIREPVTVLTNFKDGVARHTEPPAIGAAIPPEYLPAGKGCIKVKRLVRVQGKGAHR
jgi:hypothetical protein